MHAQDALQRNPKSYSAWFQRQWIIDRGLGDLQKEIGLCDKLLELDERNFHCWNYRRHVCQLAGATQADELAFSTLKIEQNFSNYSVRCAACASFHCCTLYAYTYRHYPYLSYL